MIAFAVYAVLVWYAAAKWRRHWRSFAWIAAGAAGLALLGFFHWRLSVWTNGRIYYRVLQALLYPYSIMVVGIGLYIACLPRPVPRHWCAACRYDLTGLQNEVDLCPECGTPHALGLIPGPAARPLPAEAQTPGAPGWPPIAAAPACHHQAEQ